jgi:hypothetical protein
VWHSWLRVATSLPVRAEPVEALCAWPFNKLGRTDGCGTADSTQPLPSPFGLSLSKPCGVAPSTGSGCGRTAGRMLRLGVSQGC